MTTKKDKAISTIAKKILNVVLKVDNINDDKMVEGISLWKIEEALSLAFEAGKRGALVNLVKGELYIVNGKEGQYELTTEDSEYCFFMSDSCQYEYFKNPIIKNRS